MESSQTSASTSSEDRLEQLLNNPAILDHAHVEDVYEDLAMVNSALVKVRDVMDHRDPRFARVYTSLAELRNADKIGFDCDHIGIDDHQGAHEWRQDRKSKAIKVLTPALALLEQLQKIVSPPA